MKRAAGQALIAAAVVFTIVAVLVSLTGCGKQETQLDRCIAWVGANHPDNADPTQACTLMLTEDPTAFEE